MKAKLKGTGFIVNVEPYYYEGWFMGYQDMTAPMGVVLYKPEDLIFGSEPDWDAYRREAAKDIVCAVLSAGMEQTDDKGKNFHSFEELAKASVKWADELIRLLKEEE